MGDDSVQVKFECEQVDPLAKDARITFHTRSAVQSALQTFLYFYIFRPRRSRSAAAYNHQTFPWTICRSVRLSVCPSVGLSSALWKNGGSDPDVV